LNNIIAYTAIWRYFFLVCFLLETG